MDSQLNIKVDVTNQNFEMSAKGSAADAITAALVTSIVMLTAYFAAKQYLKHLHQYPITKVA